MGEAVRVTGPLGRTVQEVLQSILSPQLSREVLRDACARARRSSFPEDPNAAAEIIEGPLHDMVAELFGDDAAEILVLDLAPVIQMATSGVRRRAVFKAPRLPETLRPEQVETPTPVAVSAGLEPLEIIFASFAPGLPVALTSSLDGLARTRLINDAFGLLTAVEARSTPVWIVLDGHRPCVDVPTLAAFLRSLPADCRVLLWGCDDPAARRIVQQRPAWSSIGECPSWDELAVTLRAMVIGGI